MDRSGSSRMALGLRLTLVLVCSLIGGTADAQQDVPSVLLAADADGDGRLQRSEAPISVLTKFSEIDRDGDGAIDTFEAHDFERRKRGKPRSRTGARRRAPEATAATEKRPPETMVELIQARDRNRDGKLGTDEIPSSLVEGFRRLDANNDGFIDEAEAKVLDERRAKQAAAPGETQTQAPAQKPRPRRRSLTRTLALMDTNGDGLLQKKEAPLGVQNEFPAVDANGDGALDAEEAAAGDRARAAAAAESEAGPRR